MESVFSQTPNMTPKHPFFNMNDILVIDDRLDNLRLLMGILTEQGYDIRAASECEPALKSAQLAPPDLILLDIRMPDMDGYEVCTRLKADDRTRDIPVIFMSALDEMVDKVKGFTVGGVDYITKPFQAEEVLARVDTHLTLRKTQQRLEAQNAQLHQEIAAHKQTERSLKELRYIVERSPVIVFLWRAAEQWPVEFVSENIRQFGYTPEDFYTQHLLFANIIHPDDLKRVGAEMSQCCQEGRIECTQEYRIITKTGDVRWTSAHAWIRSDAAGTITHYQGIVIDSTERKLAEEALRRSEAQKRALLDAIPDLMFHLTREGMFLAVHGTKEQLSVAPEHIVGQNITSFLPPDIAIITMTYIHETLETGGMHTYEYPLPMPVGIQDYEARMVPVGNDDVIVLVRNMTKQKQAEQQMRLDEERLESLLKLSQMKETSIQIILDVALEEAIQLTHSQIGYIYSYNEATQRFTLNSWSKEVMPACTIAEPQTIYELENTGIWGEAVRQRQPIIINDYDAPNPLKHGYPKGHVPLKTFLTIPVIFDGQIVAVIGVANKAVAYDFSDIRQLTLLMESIWNIRQRKRVEAQFRLAKEAAETANQAKSTFLANVSHELRTPLNGILGYTQILKHDGLLGDHHMKAIDTIHRSGEHLLDMINDVLDLAKVEAGKIELQPIEFSLSSSLATIVDIMRIKARHKGIEFVYEPMETFPYRFLGDEKRIRQVLLNLLGNAIKFTPRGQVTFRVTDCGLQARTEEPTACIRFEVEDSGIGIPAEKMTDIFRPFEQVDDPRVRSEGTGLGLAISSQIVHLMGSKLQVDSTPEEGSRFWFEIVLPIMKAVEPPSTAAQTRHIVGIKNRTPTLLLVDDCEDNRLVLREVLQSLGFELAEAANGHEALEQVPVVRPDLIFLDLKMPIMDGYEALPCLRALEVSAHIPIIALTAGVYDHIRQQSLKDGCDDFLTKPIQLDRLFKILEQHLQIEWRYDDVSPAIASVTPSRQELATFFPSHDELLALKRLAVLGDIIELRQSLDRLEQSDAALLPFVKTFRALSDNFEIDAIQKKLEQYLDIDGPDDKDIHHNKKRSI